MGTHKKKILIVDDEYSSRRLLGQIIRNRFDCYIEESDDGSEALAKMIADPPDLVILDMVMPFMNGIQVLKTMRENQKLSHIKVLACTAVDDNNVVKEIIRLGVKSYLKKPIQKEAVIQKVEPLLQSES